MSSLITSVIAPSQGRSHMQVSQVPQWEKGSIGGRANNPLNVAGLAPSRKEDRDCRTREDLRHHGSCDDGEIEPVYWEMQVASRNRTRLQLYNSCIQILPPTSMSSEAVFPCFHGHKSQCHSKLHSGFHTESSLSGLWNHRTVTQQILIGLY